MRTNRWVLSVVVMVLATARSSFSATYVDVPFNRLVTESTVIMVGEVIISTLETEPNGDVFRATVLRPVTMVRGGVEPGSTLTVRTFEGTSVDEVITSPSPFRVEFREGGQAFLMLKAGGRGGAYEIAGLFRGKLDVVDGVAFGTRVPLNSFLARVGEVLSRGDTLRTDEIPSVASQLPRGPGLAKAMGTGSHFAGQFYAMDSYVHNPPPLTIAFEINPSGAFDGDSNKVSFASLKAAAEACAAEWNSIYDGYVNFTIAADSSSRTPHAYDAYSTITFENLTDGTGAQADYPLPYGAIMVSDIVLNTDYLWSPTETYPSSWSEEIQPLDFREVVTHEMGHSVGLFHCDDAYDDNTMYFSSTRGETKRRTLEWGDEAGGVYMTTRPGRSGDGSIDFDQVWSAFLGSSQLVQLQQNISVPSGKKLWIDVTTGIDWNGKTISASGGEIEVHDDTGVTPDTVEARKGAVRISFNNPSATRLSNVVRYGTTSGSYNNYKVISTTNGRNNVVVNGLTNGARYYFKLGNGVEESNTPHSCRSDYDGDGSTIDFDDFFLWADHYGDTVTSDALQRFDLSGNALIDSTSDFVPFFYPDFGQSCASIPKNLLAEDRSVGKNRDAVARLAVYPGSAEVEVDIETSGAQIIKGYGLVIAYDTSVLTYQGPAEGAGLLARPGATVGIEKVDNGQLMVGALLKPGEPIAAGDGLLARLVFRPVGATPEQPPVALLEAFLADDQTQVNKIAGQTTSSEARITRLELAASPNPLNPSAAILFGLPESGVCDLRVYDLLGQQVKTLVDGEFRFAGSHRVTWGGVDNSGQPVASGTYLVQLRFRGLTQTQRLTVVR